MNRKQLTFAGMFLVLAPLGCRTTGDPNEGGFFGWSRDKAEARQEDLRRQLEAEEASLYQTEAERNRLQGNLASRSADVEELRRYNDFLQADIVTRTQLLVATESLGAAKKSDLSRVQSELEQLNSNPSQEPSSLQQELLRLRAEIDAIESSRP